MAFQATADEGKHPDESAATTGLDESALARVGGVCAVVGAIVSVAAGIMVGNATNSFEPAETLRFIAELPSWYWPIGHLGFIIGALLWVGTFIVLIRRVSAGASRVFARSAAVTVVIGVTIHFVDSLTSGYALNAAAGVWSGASGPERADLFRSGQLLLWVLDGTWAGVLVFFHGIPFLLIGIALILDSRHSTWLGWVAGIAGLASTIAGTDRYLGSNAIPEPVFVVSAVVVSIWMTVIGVLMYRRAARTARTRGAAFRHG